METIIENKLQILELDKIFISKTNPRKTIDEKALNELECIGKYYKSEEVVDVVRENKDDFEVLSKFELSDSEEFLRSICNYVYGIRHGCVMFNLFTLMDNCADPNLDHLDFKPDLKRGLELLELEKSGKLKLL